MEENNFLSDSLKVAVFNLFKNNFEDLSKHITFADPKQSYKRNFTLVTKFNWKFFPPKCFRDRLVLTVRNLANETLKHILSGINLT